MQVYKAKGHQEMQTILVADKQQMKAFLGVLMAALGRISDIPSSTIILLEMRFKCWFNLRCHVGGRQHQEEHCHEH